MFGRSTCAINEYQQLFCILLLIIASMDTISPPDLRIKILKLSDSLSDILDELLPKEDMEAHDVPSWIEQLFKKRNPAGDPIRIALGFPVGKDAKSLAMLLTNKHPFCLGLRNTIIRRLFYIMRHVSESRVRLPIPLNEDTSHRLAFITAILNKFPRYRVPQFEELLPYLINGERLPVGEGIIDPDIFTLIYSFEQYRITLQRFSQEVPTEHSDMVMNYLKKYLDEVFDGNRVIDDDATLSWALYIISSISLSEALPYLNGYLVNYVNLSPPSQSIRSLSLLPEIFTFARSQSFEIINLSAIYKIHLLNGKISDNILDDIFSAILRGSNNLLNDSEGIEPKHLYLTTNVIVALSQFEKTMHYHNLINAARDKVINLSKYSALPGYICTDGGLHKSIVSTIDRIENHLKSKEQKRLPILIYGPSGSGKSHFVKCIYEYFGYIDSFQQSQVKAPNTKMLRSLINSAPGPFYFIDEVDSPGDGNLYANMLCLIDDGKLPDNKKTVKNAIIFYAGSLYQSAHRLQQHLDANREGKWAKGIDWYNRCKGYTVNLSGDSLSNVDTLYIMALSYLCKKHNTPLVVDFISILKLVEMLDTTTPAIRQLEALCDDKLVEEEGIYKLRNLNVGHQLTVV